MEVSEDGKLDMWGRLNIKILNEFGFNAEAMATEIMELRDKINELEDEIDELEDEIDEFKSRDTS